MNVAKCCENGQRGGQNTVPKNTKQEDVITKKKKRTFSPSSEEPIHSAI